MEGEKREDEDNLFLTYTQHTSFQPEKHYTWLSEASVMAWSISTITDYILISFDAIGAHRFSSFL
jgi:hypothetical protein